MGSPQLECLGPLSGAGEEVRRAAPPSPLKPPNRTLHVMCAVCPVEGVVTIESSCDLLLTGGSVVTVDDERRVIEPGAVAIDGDRIVAVGPADELAGWSAARRVDCSGRAIVPGFIDCHSHLFQSLARGLGTGWRCGRGSTSSCGRTRSRSTPQEAQGRRPARRRAGGASRDDLHHRQPLRAERPADDALDRVGHRRGGLAGRRGAEGSSGRRRRSPAGWTSPAGCSPGPPTRSWRSRGPASRREVPAVAWWSGRHRSTSPTSVRTCCGDSVELAREFGVGWHTHCSEGDIDPGDLPRGLRHPAGAVARRGGPAR